MSRTNPEVNPQQPNPTRSDLVELQKEMPVRIVQPRDNLSKIVKSLTGEIKPQTPVDYRSSRIRGPKPTTLAETRLIYPGQKVWVEAGKLVIADELPSQPKVAQPNSLDHPALGDIKPDLNNIARLRKQPQAPQKPVDAETEKLLGDLAKQLPRVSEYNKLAFSLKKLIPEVQALLQKKGLNIKNYPDLFVSRAVIQAKIEKTGDPKKDLANQVAAYAVADPESAERQLLDLLDLKAQLEKPEQQPVLTLPSGEQFFQFEDFTKKYGLESKVYLEGKELQIFDLNPGLAAQLDLLFPNLKLNSLLTQSKSFVQINFDWTSGKITSLHLEPRTEIGDIAQLLPNSGLEELTGHDVSKIRFDSAGRVNYLLNQSGESFTSSADFLKSKAPLDRDEEAQIDQYNSLVPDVNDLIDQVKDLIKAQGQKPNDHPGRFIGTFDLFKSRTELPANRLELKYAREHFNDLRAQEFGLKKLRDKLQSQQSARPGAERLSD
ncbi:MAG: hypothetical protein V1936_02320 [Patescibacteria group bacterium]